MTRRPRLWRRRRRVALAGAVAWAAFVLAVPVRLLAPGVQVERPQPALRHDLMGLPDPALMARLILAESSGNPQAVSPRGAVGLCQIMPALARSLGGDPDRLTDAEYNMSLGARWLGTLIDRYGVDLALRVYNVGETRRHLWHTAPVDAYVAKIKEGQRESHSERFSKNGSLPRPSEVIPQALPQRMEPDRCIHSQGDAAWAGC